MAPQRMPRGVLPDGVAPPVGTDIMQFCRDLAESGADFAEQFDRDSSKFHAGLTAAVPTGGTRVPETMGGAAAADWQSLPEPTLAIEEDFGPEFHAAMAAHTRLGQCKKALSVLNKPVEMAMRLRVQYRGAAGEDRTALESRLHGAETERDGALSAAGEILLGMDPADVSERTRDCVGAAMEQGMFKFEDKETFGEYMQVLQRANQAIFADQKRLLQRIKDVKKAAKAAQVVAAPPTAEAAAAAEEGVAPAEEPGAAAAEAEAATGA